MKNKPENQKKSISIGMLESLRQDIMQLSHEMASNAIFGIVGTSDLLTEYLRIELKRSVSTQTKYYILNTLVIYGGALRLVDISKKIFLHKSSVTRAVYNLEKDGLIVLNSGVDDRRTKTVTITKQGLELIEKTMDRRREITEKVVLDISTEEMEALVRILKQVRKNIKKLL